MQIARDPIYGTPVFGLVGGRSKCPHEHGTDAREGVRLGFPSQVALPVEVLRDT